MYDTSGVRAQFQPSGEHVIDERLEPILGFAVISLLLDSFAQFTVCLLANHTLFRLTAFTVPAHAQSVSVNPDDHPHLFQLF
ncbi:MAG TPA: hypothetical protein PLU93_07460 [Treponemataceae bacterium]|nr:hypothetical protein [Treponemataceae bacterium]